MKLKNYLLLLAIGIIWGSQFIFQEIALTSFPPIWIGAARAVIGAITLILICKSMGLKGNNNQWFLFSSIGLLDATIPFVIMPWAQQNLSSSIAALLMGTLPFYVLLLAPFFITNSKITIGNLISVMIGFSGLLILFYPELSSRTDTINILSSLGIIVAAICFAIALLLLNQVRNEHPIIVARNILSMAAIQLIVIAFVSTPIKIQSISHAGMLALLYLGVICAGIVYYLYMISIKNAGAVFTSMTNYIVPTAGVIIGATMSNDIILLNTWLALAVILSALFMNQLLSINEQQS